ncbi:MAG TPA: hypothetical protein VKR29_04150 [Candidatus Binataceae bacterium]|nr:hypothetical protein [Candidatus Binataceae bacterium]
MQTSGGKVGVTNRFTRTMRLASLLTLTMLSGFFVTARAVAEDLSDAIEPLPPGTFTSSQHSDEWKIKNALSAAPPWITDKAAVVELSMEMNGHNHRVTEHVIRPGTNGWTCMPDDPGRPQHDPMCGDQTTMMWLTAVMEGRKPNIHHAGLSYMLLGEARQGQNVPPAKDPSSVRDWYYIGPHVMVVLPDDDMEAFKDTNEDLSKDGQYVTSLNHSKSLLWVIPVAKAGERIKPFRPELKASTALSTGSQGTTPFSPAD